MAVETSSEQADVVDKVLNEKAPIDHSEGHASDFAVLKDGITTHPLPTADPLDPLNWSFAKKHTILAIVMYL